MVEIEFDECSECGSRATVEVVNDCEATSFIVCNDCIDAIACAECDSEILPLAYRYNN